MIMDVKGSTLGKEGAHLPNSNAWMQSCSVQWQKTPEQKRAEQLKKRAIAAAIRRANETPEQTAERRRKNRERQRRSRAETLRKSLAMHAGSEMFGPTNINSVTGKEDAGVTDDNNGLQSYICLACKAKYDNPIEYFDHIQQDCLNFYLDQPEVFSKILAFVKSKMNEIQQTEQLSKPGNGTIEKPCVLCGETFLVFTASTLSLPESLCPACRKSQPIVNTTAQRVGQHGRILTGTEFEKRGSKNQECNAIDLSRANNMEDSGSQGDTENHRSANCDLIEGAVPPKRPLLKCETALPSYLWPNQISFPIKSVRLCYSKNEPYKKHHCWECDSPILPTSKRFIDHFKMMYECQWCIYTTHCHQASVDHVMRMHAGEEAAQKVEETQFYPDVSAKTNSHAMQAEDCEDDDRPMVKLEPPDMDDGDLSLGFKSNNCDTAKTSCDSNEEIVAMPPVNLRCLEITSTTLLIQWDPPPEDRVTSYALLFQGSGAPSQQLLPAERTLIRLAGLTPDTLYVVRVYTVYHDAHSQYATIFRQTSKVEESAYASEVLQPCSPSFSMSQSDAVLNDLIKNAFHHQRDDLTQNANDLLDNVHGTGELISNIKQEAIDNDDAV